MSMRDVVTTLAEHWPETLPHLEAADLRLIAELIQRIDTASEDDHAVRTAALNVTEMLIVKLPSGHPVRNAIFAETRLLPTPTDWPRIASMLRTLADIDLGQAGPSHSPDADGIQDKLLEAPSLTTQQVTDHGENPNGDDLIRLSAQSGAVQLPAFQFGPDGHPIPVVAEINRMLQAAQDPWGVADWWLGRNAWLNATPAELIGQVDDELLTLAARAEFLDG